MKQLVPLRARHILALATVVAATACEVSREEEAQLGAEAAREIGSQLPLVTDQFVVTYVNELGRRIALTTSEPDLDWQFFVVNSPQVNAFALPGGFIYVNRGLIEATTSLGELAGVLGHEIGHVVQRHSVEQLQNRQKIGVVASLACTLTNICESGIGEAAIMIGGTALIARYSRADELEADSEAVENVLRVGVDPAGVPSLFERLLERRETQPTMLDGWFATHPLEESRIENARALIAAAGADTLGGLIKDLPSYVAFRRRVASLPMASGQR